MARKRQQDLTPGPQTQIVAPKASAVNLSFGARIPKPVDLIAFDFRGLSRTLDTLAGRASQDRKRLYERTAEEARQVFIKAQLEGVDSENELFERWQEHAANSGLTEAATVHGQREIARATGRGKAAHLISQVRIKVEMALQSEDEVPENSSTFWKEALETAEIDLDGLDFYQMEGLGPLMERSRIEFDEALAQEEYMRDTAVIHEAAQSRVIGYFEGPELSVAGLSEIVGGLSTSENGSLYPVNRKPILLNALIEAQVKLDDDPEAFLDIMDVADELDFGGTKFSDDQSSPDLPGGNKGETYALQLARMRRTAVQNADRRAVNWQVRSQAKINKATGITAEYYQSIDLADDGILSNEEIGSLHEEISRLLGNAGLTTAEVAQSMLAWSADMRTAQSGVRTGSSADRRERKDEQALQTDLMISLLVRNEVTSEDVLDMTNVSGAVELYGAKGVVAIQLAAKTADEFATFTTHPITKRVGEILSTREGFEGLSADELATLNDTADQTLAEVQSAFQVMMTRSSALPTAALQAEIEGFLKSSLVTDAVESHRKVQEEARIKTADRDVELKRITGFLNTTAMRAMAGDQSLPTAIRVKAEEGIALADRNSIPQTWGQYNGFLGRLGALFNIDKGDKLGFDDETIGALSSLIDRQQAGAATEFVAIAQEHFRQGLEGNERPVTVVQKEALEFAMEIFEQRSSTPVARLIRAQDFGGKELVTATENNDSEAKKRNIRIEAARGLNSRSFEIKFRLALTNPETRANESNIKDISDDLYDAASVVYGMEPGAPGWAEAQQQLQIEGRKAANEILSDLDGGELTPEQGQQLFNIGQITPGFWSLDDIAETGMLTHRTKGNEELIIKLQAEQSALEREIAPVLKQRLEMIAKEASTIGGRRPLFNVDAQIFARLSDQRDVFLKKQQKAHRKVRDAIKKAREFNENVLAVPTEAIKAVTDGNINPLTVPWKRSYEELLKYKNERPENWIKFLAAIGNVDETQFLKEQRLIYK